MNVKRFALIVLSIAILTSLTISYAYAGTAKTVRNLTIGINESDDSGVVNLNAIVKIWWTGITPSTGTVDVTVYKPDGTKLPQWLNLEPTQSGKISFVVDIPGEYLVVLEGNPNVKLYGNLVAYSTIFALPESVLGTSITLIAGFAAVGMFGVVRKKQSKNKKA